MEVDGVTCQVVLENFTSYLGPCPPRKRVGRLYPGTIPHTPIPILSDFSRRWYSYT